MAGQDLRLNVYCNPCPAVGRAALLPCYCQAPAAADLQICCPGTCFMQFYCCCCQAGTAYLLCPLQHCRWPAQADCVGCRERGEDDTSFERQSSLFALAVADVLLVNMWAKDVGREAGSGKPLLKTIFQVRLPKPP